MYIAVFDVGTSAVKGVLIDQEAKLNFKRSINVATYYGDDGEMEQNPLDWWESVKNISKQWWDVGIDPETINMVTFAGQMEDVIPIAYSEQAQTRAILYSDTRADREAGWIEQKVPAIQRITGNTIKASTPIAKLVWLQHQQANQYAKTSQFVFSAKDYIIYQLTDEVVTDPTTGATTGMMNIETRNWERDILNSIGIDTFKLPALIGVDKTAGHITSEAAYKTGFRTGTPVLCGSGDAGASTMGAGAVEVGDSYFYIGTTGWAAVIQEDINANIPAGELFQLAHLPDRTTILIAPLLNAGNVHRWAVDTFVDVQENDKYAAFEQLVLQSPVGSNGVLFLPYLNGERFPVSDPNAKGAFSGIGPNTARSDFSRAVVEGIAFSLKQLIEVLIDEADGAITLIGGGSNSAAWCSILADCLEKPIRVPEDSTFMPAIGAASSAFIRLGWASDYSDFAKRCLKTESESVYVPDDEHHRKYEEIYQRYLQLHPRLKGIY